MGFFCLQAVETQREPAKAKRERIPEQYSKAYVDANLCNGSRKHGVHWASEMGHRIGTLLENLGILLLCLLPWLTLPWMSVFLSLCSSQVYVVEYNFQKVSIFICHNWGTHGVPIPNSPDRDHLAQAKSRLHSRNKLWFGWLNHAVELLLQFLIYILGWLRHFPNTLRYLPWKVLWGWWRLGKTQNTDILCFWFFGQWMLSCWSFKQSYEDNQMN